MNKKDLIDTISRENGLTRAEAHKLVHQVFQAMTDALAQGGRVEFRGLGTFKVKKYRAYKGRNPKSGKTVKVKAKRLPFFKPGRELKVRVDRKQ